MARSPAVMYATAGPLPRPLSRERARGALAADPPRRSAPHAGGKRCTSTPFCTAATVTSLIPTTFGWAKVLCAWMSGALICQSSFALRGSLECKEKGRDLWCRGSDLIPIGAGDPTRLSLSASAAAASVTVNVLTDNATDSCPATCSLRAALATASAGDEIQFSVSGTIVLSAYPNNSLLVDYSV